MKKIVRWSFVVAQFIGLILIVNGCGYSLKPSLPENIKKIAIPTFTNKSMKYGIETKLTDAVIRQFLVDGRLEVVDKDKSDAILEGVIVHYLLQPMAYDANNVVLQYRLKMQVDIKFIDTKENKVLWTQPQVGGITGGSTTFTVSGTNSSPGSPIETEYDAQVRIYDKIAQDVVNRTIYGWENF
jgi:outer membrane lipopolysaccharide assembly protein LptE/RlpB